MTVERVQARVFGEVAGEYQRVRPDYPQALADDVLAYAALEKRPALEVGAGTGKATLAFARYGIALTALEPDVAMAAVLSERVQSHGNVTVTVSLFEDYLPEQPFGLLFSAQAWHWTDPATRWQRAARALAPGGALALFWNINRLADRETMGSIVEAHQKYAPHIVLDTDPVTEAAIATVWPRTDLEGLAEFGDLSQRLYRRDWILSRADFLAYLSTQSPYRMLDEAVRAQLFQAIGDQLGEQVVLDLATSLYLARRR